MIIWTFIKIFRTSKFIIKVQFKIILLKSRENNTWIELYINLLQIDWRLVNTITNRDLNLTQVDNDY